MQIQNKNSHIIATYEYTEIDGTNPLRLSAIDNFCITYFGNDMAVLPSSYSRGAFYITIYKAIAAM